MRNNIRNTMVWISISLLIFYFNSAKFVSEYIRYEELDKSFYELEDLSGILILFWLTVICLSFLLIFYLLRCTYKHKNKLIFTTILLMFTTIIQILNIWILIDIASVRYRTDALIIWINTHNWIPAIFVIGCIGGAIQIAITIYLLANYKFKKKDSSDTDSQLERNQIMLFSGMLASCLIICVVLFIGKGMLLQQEIVLDYKEDEMFIPNIEGYNEQGYFNANNSDYPNSPIRDEVLSGDKYAFTENRQLYYLKYLFMNEDIEYRVVEGENGTYQNGDVAKLQMKFIESNSSYNIKIEGVTTYEVVVEGLEDYEYKSYENINADQLDLINESLNSYIDNWLEEDKAFGFGSKAKSITLVKKGFYNAYGTSVSKSQSDDFDPQSFTTIELTEYNYSYNLFHKENELVYLYKVETISNDSFFVTVSLDLNTDNLERLEKGETVFDYYRWDIDLKESEFLTSVNEKYGDFMLWIEE